MLLGGLFDALLDSGPKVCAELGDFPIFSPKQSCVHNLYSVGSEVNPAMLANEESCRGRARASEEVRQ